MNDLQADFTKGRSAEDNVFILYYCIKDSRRRRKGLAIAAIDFEKAFVPVNEECLIKAIERVIATRWR